MASEKDQRESLAVETVNLPEWIKITDGEIELIEAHLRDILISMLQADEI